MPSEASSWEKPRTAWSGRVGVWGKPKSVAGKWIAPPELLVGCVAADLACGVVAADDAADGACEIEGAVAPAQPAASTTTPEVTAIVRPIKVRRGRARGGLQDSPTW